MPPRRAFDCPHCGARVPAGARACPGCGSDAQTGWSEEADAWAGDLPTGYGDDEDEFDYDEFLRDEGLADDAVPSRRARVRRRTTIVVLLLIACLLLWLAWRGT